MANEILPNEDFEVSEFLRKNLIKKGVQFHLNSSVTDIKKKDGLELSYKDVNTKKISNYNFEKIISIIDGSEKDIMKGFKELSNITTDKDYVLIYYSGHGDNRGINNYWIPVDGEKEFGLGDWINTAEISNYIMQEIPNHHIVLMSDSCYFDVKTKSNQILNDRKSLSYQN